MNSLGKVVDRKKKYTSREGYIVQCKHYVFFHYYCLLHNKRTLPENLYNYVSYVYEIRLLK